LQIARVMLASGPISGADLCALFDGEQSTISRNLRRMDAAGLVTSHREGGYVLYELTGAGRRVLNAFISPPDTRDLDADEEQRTPGGD